MIEPHEETINNHLFEMLPVEGGTFFMGSPDDDNDALEREKPQHEVKVSAFLIGKYPVTQALWKAVMKGENPSRFQADDLPVEQVSWDDITQKFLLELRRLTGLNYRLPSEAEWEFAARGGKYHTEGYKYAGSDRLKDVGWFDENSDQGTKPIGLKSPNQLGIYDMSGNVWEWCEDDWHDNYDGAPEDGLAWFDRPSGAINRIKNALKNVFVDPSHNPQRGTARVFRGGSWNDGARNCRVANRNDWQPVTRRHVLGFRLVLSLQADGCPSPAFL